LADSRGGLCLLAQLFGPGHSLQQRDLARFIKIDTYTKVNLVSSWVGVESFVQSQDRVSGGQFNGGKKTHAYSLCWSG
jgi:hypothetical protein